MTIYAKEVPPEYSESPLWCGMWDYNEYPVIVTRNEYSMNPSKYSWEHDYKNLWIEIRDKFEDMCYEYQDMIDDVTYAGERTYDSFEDILKDFVYKYETKDGYAKVDWTEEIIKQVEEVVQHWLELRPTSYQEDFESMVAVLSIITGLDWKEATLRECCQGEYAEILYFENDDYVKFDKYEFEELYFNTGQEWIIHDSDDEVTCADDVEGYYLYVTNAWNTDMVKDKLRNYTGASPDEEVVLFVHDGYIEKSVYKTM